MGIVITDIVSEYGSYYLNHGQNKNDLAAKFFRPSETAKYFAKQPTSDTVARNGAASIDRVLQGFQKAFTPIGNLTFKPNPVNLYQLKVDKQEYPDEIVDSWLGFLEGEGIDRAAWPFVRWMMEEHIIPQLHEDFELNEAYKGVYAAPTPGTAGAAGTAMNGIKKQIADYITAGRSVAIAMGAVPTDEIDFCTYVETFVASLPMELRKRIDGLFMNEDLHLRYKEGKRKKYNLQYAQTTDLETVFHYPNARVIGLASHNGSNKIWTTTPKNRKRWIKKENAITAPAVKEFSARAISIYTDWWEVLGFVYPEIVYATDQA